MIKENKAVRVMTARLAVMEAAIVAILRVHPVPHAARDAVRDATEGLLMDMDDAPDAVAAAAATAQCNALCEAWA